MQPVPIVKTAGRTARGALWALALLLAPLLGGCGGDPSRKGYDQSSPDGVIKTARLMVEGGHAERLGELMYADSPEWRELYLRLGELLGEVQDLADSVQANMPEEVAQVKADAVAAAREGRASNFIQQALTGRRAARSNAPASTARGSGPDPRRMLNDTLKQLSSDPYGWLEESEDRLGFVWIDDFTVALTWDNKAILPPIGITMKQAEDGLWYLVLPTSLPQLRPVVPDTPEEFSIWASIIQVMDNAVTDMRTTVDRREVRNLDDLSRKAGENLLLPMGLVFIAYGKLVEEDMRAQREAARAERRAREASGEGVASTPAAPATIAPPPGPDAPIDQPRPAVEEPDEPAPVEPGSSEPG
jgi:hypothetical protein